MECVLTVNENVCDELLYGRVGYAYALLFVKYKISSELIPNILLDDVILLIFIMHVSEKMTKIEFSSYSLRNYQLNL